MSDRREEDEKPIGQVSARCYALSVSGPEAALTLDLLLLLAVSQDCNGSLAASFHYGISRDKAIGVPSGRGSGHPAYAAFSDQVTHGLPSPSAAESSARCQGQVCRTDIFNIAGNIAQMVVDRTIGDLYQTPRLQDRGVPMG
ncbi:hypothetical protein TgHK011_004758 [Trichoderma gracile]|nr:hypothetical protein TgHK011_004758 [Trichoderma gracile]